MMIYDKKINNIQNQAIYIIFYQNSEDIIIYQIIITMKQAENSSAPILDDILNNTNCTLSYNSRDYIILIKKQKNKDYCTLFLTDCSDKFWIEKIDINYCQKLKQQMNVKTKTELFAKHFTDAFKNNPKLESIQPSAKLKLQIKISQGLIINCPISFSICISCDESPEQYKQLVRSFFKQLYEAKEHQIQELKKQIQKQKQQPKAVAPKQNDKNYVRNVLNIPEKKQAILPKNRDLINPHKSKRKHEGLKLTGCD